MAPNKTTKSNKRPASNDAYRARKKRTTSSRTNIIPDITESAPEVVNQGAASRNHPPSRRRSSNHNQQPQVPTIADAISLLKHLQLCSSVADAKECMEYMDGVVMNMSVEERTQISIDDCDYGMLIVISALERLSQSKACVATIMSFLVEVTCYEDRSGKYLLKIGAVKTILDAVNVFEDNENDGIVADMKAHVVSIFLNLSLADDTMDDVFAEECVDFVARAMVTYKHHAYTQSSGCRYFNEMSKFNTLIGLMIQKGVERLLVDARQEFRSRDDDDYGPDLVYAKEALQRLLDL